MVALDIIRQPGIIHYRFKDSILLARNKGTRIFIMGEIDPDYITIKIRDDSELNVFINNSVITHRTKAHLNELAILIRNKYQYIKEYRVPYVFKDYYEIYSLKDVLNTIG